MSIAVSPMATDQASPMILSMTPVVEPRGQGVEEEGQVKEADSGQRYEKPPPLHTGADWKVVLHLPQIETWLRVTTERVRDLTHSVQQDAENKHVDVHLVQLKDICEDISDHVEQIHALLETEFSLKLLSYSVNIIVDIHTVQLLWHQLRVSVLVLKERVLQGLQDSNGNFTRQTDILQAFSEDKNEARLDSLTEVDDSGQLTIKCSQDYFSLDCGITAFELSDYSPSEDLPTELDAMTPSRIKSKTHEACYYPDLEKDFPELIQSVGLLTVAAERLSSKQEENISNQEGHSASTPEISEENSETSKKSSPLSGIDKPSTEPSAIPDNSSVVAIGTSCQTHQSVPNSQHHSHCENSISKRPIRDCFNYNEVSPTQPSLPKKAMYLEGMSRDDIESVLSRIHPSSLLIQAEMSRSTPSLLDPADRSKFCLELTSVYPSNTSSSVSQSYDCLNKISDKNHKVLINASSYKTSLGPDRLKLTVQSSSETDRPSDLEDQSSYGESRYAPSTESPHCCNEISSSAHKDRAVNSYEVRGQSLIAEDDQSNLPGSPMHSNQKDSNAGSPESALTSLVPLLPKDKHERSPNQSNGNSKMVEPWYGSDEYLALPAQLKKTEMLAQKLENLAKVLPEKHMEETIQDIDDWELSEVNSDFEAFAPFHPNRRYEKAFGTRMVSPTSSSDIAPSLDESIESGPLSDLLSEDELPIQEPRTESCVKEKVQKGWVGPASCDADDPNLSKQALIQQLLEDIHHQDNYEAVWEKIEGFVSKLDEFICWLHEALEATENWTPPMAETDSLKLYLETHLSFKLNVDSHCSLKEAVVEEGRQLLELIVSHKSGLKDMLQMILSQWQELQRQIKRQHSWILLALEIIKEEILASDVSQEDEHGTGSPKGEAQLCDLEARRDVVEQMSLKLYSEQYSNSTKRKKEFAEMSKVNRTGSNSLLDFESEYQELWDWLIDIESIVMDSHDLMMSEEQQQHLCKGNSVEMAMWQPKKAQLLGRVESLKRSGAVLPTDLEDKVGALTKKWDLLEKSLGERMPGTGTEQTGVGPRDLLSPETGSLVRQLEVRIKELKGWLRDTELFIFNSCLRKEKEETLYTQKQLQYFKSLCCEIRQRRSGIASVLRLCQRLLDDQDSCALDSEQQSMQLTIVNLERRWEAIVMQAIQWQTKLQKELGTEQVPMNIIESAFMDVNGSAEDSWEWDETDISNNLISVNIESRDPDKVQSPTSNLTTESLRSTADNSQFNQYVSGHGSSLQDSFPAPHSSSPQIYHVYSLHNVELFHRPHGPFLKKTPEYPKQPNILLKSLSKDSSFSSTESLPDLLGGIISAKDGKYVYCGDVARQSESESGIVSEGDTETTANSEISLLNLVEEPAQCSELKHHKPSLNRARVYSKDTEELAENVDSQVSHKNCTKLSGNKHNSLEEKERIDGSHQSAYKYENQSVEIYVNDHESLIETESEFESHACCAGRDDKRLCCDLRNDKRFAFLSQGSSLDSLSVDGDLFTSSKDVLHRSTSLESWLVSSKSTEEFSSQHNLEEFGLSGDSIGELSKRTLDLLTRLENIQNPSNQKMKRSVSDITLQSNSLKIHPTGQMSLDIASSINGDSVASLTELSSSEDVSLCSEDLAVQKNRIVDSNASFRKHINHALPDEADVSISMIVNVSCTSACTDDEDDSDLLSSSTLTLTEEELGIKDDDDDDSSIATDDEYIESSFVLGLDYMKNELQNWIKPKISQSREKNELDLGDELQCSTLSHENITSTSTITVNERRFLSKAALKLLESNANGKIDSVHQKDLDIKKNTQEDPTSYRNQFVDDVENGNVENAQLKGKADEEEVLREEESIFINSGEPLKTDLVADCSVGTVARASSVKCDLLDSSPKEHSLEGQLRGEIPCYSSSRLKMNCHGSSQCTKQMINEDRSQDSHSAFLMDAEDKNTTTNDSPCCDHYTHVNKDENNDDDSSVHNFVMEIIDMASVALKNKAQLDPEAASPTPVAQIRDKVLEHSHRPIQLRKGDFYSYLSLSSHDSDCGEVITCSEEKSSTPVPADLSNGFEVKHGELLFEPCSEKVYIGPPLCYSRSTYQRPSASGERVSASSAKPKMNDFSLPCNGVDTVCSANQKTSVISKGTTARSQLECHNEASYLNPLPYETLIDTVECFSDTKMLESNISPVMTKIRDSCSSANPLKEEASLYINPKINCPQIRKFDRDEKGPASQWMKQKHVKKGCSSHQEAKSARKQLPRSETYTKDDQKQARGGNTYADSSDHPEP
ncbi:A-kinase anchor protein 6-like [Polyodon spathula]|uniref:A-kinase anchor protein 6-like n=1 Tax=Polyodon spathula TaxID=7913 RepID=UPI001B7E2A37|nr:A-kinase anchor protein 6-like [Polyodon spathula]XP_041132162.1 A-kinase anchor protein 6-like [Polyodon spathula]